MANGTQRSYTPAERGEAVALAHEIGAGAAAKQLGYPEDTLYTWLAREKKGLLKTSSAPKKDVDQQDELERLREENKALKSAEKAHRAEIEQLRRERQILEDATTFFASRQKK